MKDTHQENVIIYVLGLLNELSTCGIVEKGSIQLGEKGLNRFKKLKEQGFEPTEKEMEVALHVIQSKCVS